MAKDKDKPLKIAYEAVVEAVAWIFKNHNKERAEKKEVKEKKKEEEEKKKRPSHEFRQLSTLNRSRTCGIN